MTTEGGWPAEFVGGPKDGERRWLEREVFLVVWNLRPLSLLSELDQEAPRYRSGEYRLRRDAKTGAAVKNSKGWYLFDWKG